MALDTLDPLTAPMPAPPVRQFSFTDFQTNNPTAPPPGDRLDAEFDRANNAIDGTIAWANVSLNTDGTLRDAIVGESNLQPDLFDDIASDAIAQVQPLVDQAAADSASAGSSSVSASSSATTASSQAVISQGAAGRANNAQVAAEAARDASQGYADDASVAATDASNAGNDAEGAAALAQDYAVVTQAWAEHMPDPIPPNILAVMGVTGDHWSSRWWANQAAAAFGALTSLYLGAFPQPPTQTPTGGTIPIGAIYYNTTSGQPYVWTGTGWVPFYAPTKAVTLSLAYSASGAQTAFPLTTVDLAGNTYSMNATTPEPLEVWVNGVRLLLNQPAGIGDWNVNATNSTVTLTAAPRAGSIIQIDVLTPASQLAPSQVVTKGLAPFTPIDGTTTTFPLKLGDNTPITALTAAELFISVDGTVQQPGIDFSTAGGSVTFTEAPLLGSKVWSYWYGQGSGDAATGGGAAGLYLPLTGGLVTGPTTFSAPVTLTNNLSATGTSTFNRTDVGTVASFPPVLTVNYQNQATGGVPATFVAAAMGVNAASVAGNVGYTHGMLVQLTSSATNLQQSQDVGITSSVTKPGGAVSVPFGLWVPVRDTSGLDGDNVSSGKTSRGGIVGMEMDYFCNGPDNPVTSVDPRFGSRVFIHLGVAAYQPPVWAATHAYAVNAAVQPTPANGFTYVCTTGGTSGATQPVWPTAAGNVTDGTVVWKWGTTKAPRIGRAIDISGHAGDGVQFGAALFTEADFYDAILECSGANLIGPDAAAIRIGANQPIDFTGNLTDPTQNNHTLRFINTGPNRLSYQSIGRELFSVGETGAVTMGDGSQGVILQLNSANSTGRHVQFLTHGLMRWAIVTGTSAGTETGGNQGSNFLVSSYDDAGNPLGTGLLINRANGQISITPPVAAANDAAAASAGVPLNGLYRNGSVLMIRVA